MTGKLFFDTSAIYAYINRKDPDHRRIKNIVAAFKGKLVITNYIFDEIITLVSARLGHETALFVGSILRNSPQIENIWVTQNDETEAWKLFVERKDKEYSFTDCTSFVVMRRIGIKKSLALDGHFKQEGFEE